MGIVVQVGCSSSAHTAARQHEQCSQLAAVLQPIHLQFFSPYICTSALVPKLGLSSSLPLTTAFLVQTLCMITPQYKKDKQAGKQINEQSYKQTNKLPWRTAEQFLYDPLTSSWAQYCGVTLVNVVCVLIEYRDRRSFALACASLPASIAPRSIIAGSSKSIPDSSLESSSKPSEPKSPACKSEYKKNKQASARQQ